MAPKRRGGAKGTVKRRPAEVKKEKSSFSVKGVRKKGDKPISGVDGNAKGYSKRLSKRRSVVSAIKENSREEAWEKNRGRAGQKEVGTIRVASGEEGGSSVTLESGQTAASSPLLSVLSLKSLRAAEVAQFFADVEQELCAMCCRLLPHITVGTNPCFLSVAELGERDDLAVTRNCSFEESEEDEGETLRLRVRESHRRLYSQLRGSIVAACTLGHRACQVLWGPEGCGKSRLLRLVAAETRERPNTVVFYLDGSVLRSEEAGVREMASQLRDFLMSPASAAVRVRDWSIRTGSFEFGRLFGFPECLAAQSGGDKKPPAALVNEPHEGDLQVTHTETAAGSTTASNALPSLLSALHLLRRYQVNIVVCIKEAESFSVWCDQLLYMLAGLLHDDAGERHESAAEGSAFFFLLTTTAPDMKQLEKRLSSRLTPETRHVPLLGWTPRGIVRAVLQQAKELHSCRCEALGLLLRRTKNAPWLETKEGEDALEALQLRLVELVPFFPTDVLVGMRSTHLKRQRSQELPEMCFMPKKNECREGGERTATLHPNDLYEGSTSFFSPSHSWNVEDISSPDCSRKTDCTLPELVQDASLYSNLLLISNVMVMICDAVLSEMSEGLKDSKPFCTEPTIASHLRCSDESYVKRCVLLDYTASSAVNAASQLLRLAYAGSISLMMEESRVKILDQLTANPNAFLPFGIPAELFSESLKSLVSSSTEKEDISPPVFSLTPAELNSLLPSCEAVLQLLQRSSRSSGLQLKHSLAKHSFGLQKNASSKSPCLSLLYFIAGMPVPASCSSEHIHKKQYEEKGLSVPFRVATVPRQKKWMNSVLFSVYHKQCEQYIPETEASRTAIHSACDMLHNARWISEGFGSRETFLLLCTLTLQYHDVASIGFSSGKSLHKVFSRVIEKKVEDLLEEVTSPLSADASRGLGVGKGSVATSTQRRVNKEAFRLALAQLHRWGMVHVSAGTEQVRLVGDPRRLREMVSEVLLHYPEWCERELGLDSREILYWRSLLGS